MGNEEEKNNKPQDEEEKKPETEEDSKGKNEEDNGKQTEKKQEPPKDPIDQLRELTSGKLKLLQPFRAHGQDVTELRYDFCGLSNEEMMDALDSAPFNNMFAVSNSQAMAIFCATAAKCAPEITDNDGYKSKLYDARDVRKRIGPADSVKAVQLAKLFYNASSQAGGNNISKE